MLLEITGLTKDYKKGVRANDDISLTVQTGQVLGLLGHNGAGKTTLLNQVVGLAKPTSGTIRIDGIDAVSKPKTARKLCSFQPQTHSPLDRLTPRQAIELMARIRGAKPDRARKRTAELLQELGLERWADSNSDRLSGGVRRLTTFCMAAVEPGKLVMFDEPTNDVDPVRRRMLWDLIRAIAESGCGVLLVTHNVLEAERAVEHLVILDSGRVVARGRPSELRGDLANRLRVELTAADEHAAGRLGKQLDELTATAGPAVLGGRRVVTDIATTEAPRVLEWAQRTRDDGGLDEFTIGPVSLEDIYIRLVGTDTNHQSEEVR